MLKEIAFYTILGKPLIMYGGLLAFIMLMTTGVIGFLVHQGKIGLSINWHINFARVTLLLAFLHAVVGVLLFF